MLGNRKRVMIIGQPGSGKSTLARRLGAKLELPVVHIDLIHWQSGWIERTGPEKDKLCAEVHATNEWIFEGGRSSTWSERLNRAGTLIFLDFPISVRSFRILKRRIEFHGLTRPDLPDNCPENLNWAFIQFVWKTRKVARDQMIQCYQSAPQDKEKYRLHSRSEVEGFLETIER